MKVLFIRSGNNGQDPISTRQGNSLIKFGVNIEFYDLIGKGVIGYLSNILKLRKYIKTFNPNVLHAHYSFSGFITSLTFAHIPIVVSLMGSDVRLSGKLMKLFLKIFMLSWKSTIVKSEEMYLKLGCKRVHIVPNGVDFNLFYPMITNKAQDKLNWNKQKKHILFASDPKRPEKNYALAESALNILKNEIKDFEIHFLLNIPMDEMVYYYNASDLLLLTSNYEGSPNVIKEAMACNCPIVTTNVGDVTKIIGNTKNTYITSNNEFEISQKIIEVLFSNQRSNGRINIEKNNSDHIAQKLMKIYKST